MNHTVDVNLTEGEKEKIKYLNKIMKGNSNGYKHDSDALHVFQAGKFLGYFITVDKRILKLRSDLNRISGATVVKPSEWMRIYNECNDLHHIMNGHCTRS
ncbi:hypothetical protein [Hahella chejuensis]|uniref:hypothetical protein n=1 Tax=Hahella chejuensis TaxID=158327 RepID=UPI0005A1E519|nr:hypothetical protein [Hahella chejuensis]